MWRCSEVAAVARGLPNEVNFEPYVLPTESRLGPAPAGCEMIDKLQTTSALHRGAVLALVRCAHGITVVDLDADTGQDVPGDHFQRGMAVQQCVGYQLADQQGCDLLRVLEAPVVQPRCYEPPRTTDLGWVVA